MLSDRKMNVKNKANVYGTVVRLALVWGMETWALRKARENKLEVTEIKMLRWMCGVTKVGEMGNERIRGTTKVGEIAKKVEERRLKWYGHVMRREEHYVGRRAMEMKVQGRRKISLSADEVYDLATWRRAYVIVHRPHINVGIR